MKDYTFTFTAQELQTLLTGLGELPAKMSIDLILKIQEKVKENASLDTKKEKQYDEKT